MSSKRLRYIDMAKAIAMFGIVIFHTGLVYSSIDFGTCGVPNILVKFMDTFHLPTFLIVSGFFLHDDQAFNKNYLVKNIKMLILPYVVSCLLIVGISFIYTLCTKDMSTAIMQANFWTKMSLFGSGGSMPSSIFACGTQGRIGGIWFLLALFWARLILAALNRYTTFEKLLVVSTLFGLAYISAPYIWLPWSIQPGFECAFFLLIGSICYKKIFTKSLPTSVWIILGFTWLIYIFFGGTAGLAMLVFPLNIFDIIGSIAAALCVIKICQLIENQHNILSNKITQGLACIGRNTLALLCIHIIEDNILSWQLIGIHCQTLFNNAWFSWIVVCSARLVLDLLIMLLLYYTPILSRVFYPTKVKA